jgi:hypothetical protein
MQPTPTQGARSRHGGRMAAACCALAVICVTAWAGISAAAFAQGVSLPQVTGQGRMSAPIGHRQPRAQDLPPDVLREEGMSRFAPEPAPDASRHQGDQRTGQASSGDLDLQICRQC